MKVRIFLLVIAALLLCSSVAPGGMPRTINFQGVLTDEYRAPIPDGVRMITFRVWDAATEGTLVWQEVQSVNVSHGIFEVALGAVTPIDLPFDVPYWMSVQVDAEPEMTPRSPLNAAPYALRAAVADSSLAGGGGGGIGGAGTTAYVPKFTGSTTLGNSVITENNGNVGIATDTPAQPLDVNGTVQMTGFKLPIGAMNNYVLTSDPVGVGRWAPGAAGDITSITADEGLTGGGASGDAHLAVGAGDGIDALPDAIAVDVTDIAGNGLGEDASNNLVVNAGSGLEIATDNLQLTAAYRDGSAHDARFVNEGQASSVTTAMVVNDAIDANKLAHNIDASTLGFNADMVDGVHAVSISQLRYNSSLAAGSSVTLTIPHWAPWTLVLGGGWPQYGGVCHVTGFENDRNIAITYVKYNGDGTSGYGGAEGSESSTTTLVSWGSGGHTYSVQCPGEAAGDHNIVLTAAATGVELRYQLIY